MKLLSQCILAVLALVLAAACQSAPAPAAAPAQPAPAAVRATYPMPDPIIRAAGDMDGMSAALEKMVAATELLSANIRKDGPAPHAAVLQEVRDSLTLWNQGLAKLQIVPGDPSITRERFEQFKQTMEALDKRMKVAVESLNQALNRP